MNATIANTIIEIRCSNFNIMIVIDKTAVITSSSQLPSPHYHQNSQQNINIKKVSSLSLSPLHATFIFDINVKVLTVTFHFHTNEETNWYHFFYHKHLQHRN